MPRPTATAAETVTVCIPESLAAALADLEQTHPSLTLVSASETAGLVRRAPECDALVGLWGEAVGDVVRAGTKLRWVQVSSAGVKRYVSVPELRDSDIVLTNFKIYQGPEIADHAFNPIVSWYSRPAVSFNVRRSA